MADNPASFEAILQQSGLSVNKQYLRAALQATIQWLMEHDVNALTGADRYERTHERQVYRNGYRSRLWLTAAGEIPVNIPKLRRGTYYPQFLTRETERTLHELAVNAYIDGLDSKSIRTLTDKAGLPRPDRYTETELAYQLEDVIREFRERPLPDIIRELQLKVLDVTVYRDRQNIERRLVTAADTESGELLAHELVNDVDADFWMGFLRNMRRRGVERVERIVSSDYYGLSYAVPRVLDDVVYQQARVLSLHRPIIIIPASNVLAMAA